MKCPVCDAELTPVQAGSVTVDVCLGGCGGIWFDAFELQKLDDPANTAGQLLVNVKKREDLQIDFSRRRQCPRCQVIMMRHFFSPRKRVEGDECPSCGGYWLDAGELALIRDEQQTQPERHSAKHQRLTDLPATASTSPEQADARARRIDQLLRFASPIQFRSQA